MKKSNFLMAIAIFSVSNFINAQYNTDWYYPGISNSSASGYIGVGTSTSPSLNTPLPSYNFHVHGDVDYISSGTVSSMNTHNGGISNSIDKSSINYGVTSRIGLTNSMTGKTDMEGAVLQMSQLNFFIKNQSLGDLTMSVPGLSLKLSNSTSRAWMGLTPSSSTTYAKFNIASSDNGLYIQTHNNTKYGLRIKTSSDIADAFQVFGQDGITKNFMVSGAGEVYARKYTTTLNNIPDYVFDPSYKLLTFTELRQYIQSERHLPNIPSAVEMEKAPVDLGEMNRLLLEKVEELTLYILNLEERLSELEKN